jgi:hypothetical protein
MRVLSVLMGPVVSERLRDYSGIRRLLREARGMEAREARPSKAWGIAVVRGRSMQPTLYDGDQLLVRHGASPRVGDVVVVRLPPGAGGVVAVKRATMQDGDGWWVERDNPDEGVDSWSVGAIAHGDVIAVARLRLWPLRRTRLRRR